MWIVKVWFEFWIFYVGCDWLEYWDCFDLMMLNEKFIIIDEDKD